MADEKINKNDALAAEVEELKLLLAEKTAEAEKLSKVLNNPSPNVNKVKGVYKKNKKSYSFADGHFLIRKMTTGTTVPTEEVIKLANYPAYKASEKTVNDFQGLVGFKHEDAVELLDFLIDKKYGYLIEA
jgi:hypothetical protein